MQQVRIKAPLDGGYGWVITFSAFMTGFILDGFSFSFGLFYDEFLEYFRESKAKTAWIGSVYNGMYLTIGPIVSFCCNKFGCRTTSMIGGVLACVACVMAVFADNVWQLIVTYGFLGGLGFGMMYLPAIVMVGHYFEQKRALATGIAVCGSGVGAFVFAQLTRFLIDFFTWRGATLILAGVALNGVVLGALLRPLEATFRIGDSTSPTDKLPQAAFTSGEHQSPHKGFYLSLQDWHHVVNKPSEPGSLNRSQPLLTDQKQQTLRIDIARPKFRRDTFLAGSRASVHASITSATDVATVQREILRHQRQSEGFNLIDRVKAGAADAAASCRLVTENPALLIYGASCFLCMAGFYIPFTYIPVYAKTLSLHESAPQDLISVIGWVNLFSRLLIGWVGDRPWADCLLLNSASLMVGGIVTGLFLFYRTFALLVTACIVFGTCIAVFVALRSIIAVELVGVMHLSQAFGVVILCQGLSAFIGTPLAGMIADITGSTVSTFYFAGVTIFLSGLLCAPLRRLAAWKSSTQPTG